MREWSHLIDLLNQNPWLGFLSTHLGTDLGLILHQDAHSILAPKSGDWQRLLNGFVLVGGLREVRSWQPNHRHRRVRGASI